MSEPAWESFDWLTLREAAAWLRVSPKVLYRLADRDSSFPVVRVAGVLRIRRKRLESWLERQRYRSKKPMLPCWDAVENTGDRVTRRRARAEKALYTAG